MVSKLPFQTLSSSIVVIAFLFGESSHVTQGFQVSLQLYFNTTPVGNFLHFETQEPNLESYSELLPKVKLACGLGWWSTFPAANYLGDRKYFGSLSKNETECKSFDATNAKSIRYVGASETTRDVLSLYEEVNYVGKEILVEGQVYGGITTPVKSIYATGNSEWKLFEGPNLEGKSVCITVPRPSFNYYWTYEVQDELELTTVGSVFKGCDIAVIEEYKRSKNV